MIDESRDELGQPATLHETVGGGRWAISSHGLRALAIFAAVVALAAAAVAWWSRPTVSPVAPSAATVSAGQSESMIVVAVSGRVRRPGLVKLPAGSRVADAIAAAAGVLPNTDISGLNLARKLVDGELIVVGLAPGATGGGQAGLVNLNTATTEQLQTLPGVGPVLAQRIVDYREKHGGFKSVAQLREVSGIGEAKFQQLKDRVTV